MKVGWRSEAMTFILLCCVEAGVRHNGSFVRERRDVIAAYGVLIL